MTLTTYTNGIISTGWFVASAGPACSGTWDSSSTNSAPTAQNVNERVLYPQTLGLLNPQSRVLGNDYRSGYHSAQFRIDRRFSRGFSMLGAYVLSKSIDDVVAPDPGLTPGVDNPLNIR